MQVLRQRVKALHDAGVRFHVERPHCVDFFAQLVEVFLQAHVLFEGNSVNLAAELVVYRILHTAGDSLQLI